MKRVLLCVCLALFCALPLAGEPAGSRDWPQWMGPRGDGSAVASGVFPGDAKIELRELWRRPAGKAYSSISVAGGRAYTLSTDGTTDDLVALDAGDGRQLWRFEMDEAGKSMPLSTPAIDDGRVFALNARGRLHAVAAGDGSPIWSRDLVGTLGAQLPSHGMSTSPVVEGDLLLVLVGGKEHNLVAFDKTSGEVAWSVAHAQWGSYSSPVLGEIGGQRQIVVPTAERLYAVRPGDGSLLWTVDGLGYPDRNPVLLPGGRVFLPLEAAGIMVRVEDDGGALRAREDWRTDLIRNSYSPAVHAGGAVYGRDSRHLTCLDAATGDLRWRHRLSASVILVDRHLVGLDPGGAVSVVALGPEGLEERAIHWVFEAGTVTDTPPSFASGRIFVRSRREIAAVEVVASEPAP